MDINVFILELKKSLMNRGVPDSVAQKYVTSMTLNMSTTQRQQIQSYQSPEDFNRLSDNLATAIKKKENSKINNSNSLNNTENKQVTKESKLQLTLSYSVHQPTDKKSNQNVRSFKREIVTSKPRKALVHQNSDIKKDSHKQIFEPVICGPNGKKIFLIFSIVLSPILLALTVLYFCFFGFLYLFLSFLIAFCVLALIVGSTACGAFSIAGIIYGVIQYYNVPCEGKYEIGLALIIIGVIVLLDVLFYHSAINWLPPLYKYIKILFFLLSKKALRVIRYVRKECYKL